MKPGKPENLFFIQEIFCDVNGGNVFTNFLPICVCHESPSLERRGRTPWQCQARAAASNLCDTSKGYRGLVVMALGWQSFDRQVEPYPTLLWQRPCGVAWNAVPEPMVEYVDPDF